MSYLTYALEALSAAGMRAPTDVSLIGYDDAPLARDLTPKLTTAHVSYEEIGRTGARLSGTAARLVG